MTSYTADRIRQEYLRDAVTSASPARLLTMLYDRLMADLSRAEAAQRAARWDDASVQLVHAQEIVTELMGALDLAAWDGADRLFGIYGFVYGELVQANVRRDPDRTWAATQVLTPIRDAWQQAAADPASTGTVAGGSRDVA